MSSKKEQQLEDVDLDEDLFDFEEAMQDGWNQEEDADLDEIFASFEREERARAEAEARLAAQEAMVEEAGAGFEGALPDDEMLDEILGVDALGESELEGPVAALPTGEPARSSVEGTPVAAEPASRGRDTQPMRVAPSAMRTLAAPRRSASRPESTPARAAAPAPAAAPATRSMGPGLRAAAWILIAVTSVNALVALVALKSTGDLRKSVQDVGDQVQRTAGDLIRDSRGADPARELPNEADGTPLVAPDPENHPTFDLAFQEIQNGQYARARQRLYALLAIVDRLDPLVREEVEARANYLLAQALHLQAVDSWEARR